MPFPDQVREKTLVAAARYCCVCHRFKGVKVEVHHIVPESRGGTNDLENAIALCLDCHTDAGHYNPAHPRGSKYSPSELRRHRDQWYAMVKANAIRPPAEPDILLCRYLLCKSFDALREITLGDLSNAPANKPLLVTNAVRGYHRHLVETHPEQYRHEQVDGEAFVNRDALLRKHRGARIIERSSADHYPYFQTVRSPAIDELCERVAPRDVVTRLLLDADVDPTEISVALAYHEQCGQECFQEIYHVRPLWGLYLAATNVTEDVIRIEAVTCEIDEPAGLGYRRLVRRAELVKTDVRLPAAPIPVGGTILVPLATLLGPMTNVHYQLLSEESSTLRSGQVQVVSHKDISAAYDNTTLIGPALWPLSFHLAQAGVMSKQHLHEFDLSNLYTIHRFWEMGSCPHLFCVSSESGTRKYLGQLFARTPGKKATETLLVQSGTTALVIAELEPERTILDHIRVNGQIFLEGLILTQGQSLLVDVYPGDVVEITGQYESPSGARPNPLERNRVISNFIHGVT